MHFVIGFLILGHAESLRGGNTRRAFLDVKDSLVIAGVVSPAYCASYDRSTAAGFVAATGLRMRRERLVT